MKRLFLRSLLMGLFGLMLSITGQTQTHCEAYTDIIFLKNGSVFKSCILEYKQGGSIEVEIKGGHILVFAEADIEKIVQSDDGSVPGTVQKKKKKREPLPKPKDYSVEGWYHQGELGLSFVEQEWGWFETSPHLAYTFGYQFNKWAGLGVSTGIDVFQRFRPERMIPLTVDFRMYPFPKNNAVYLGVQGGYAFGLKSDLNLVTEATGGWSVMPQTGLRLQISKSAFLTAGVGFRWQQAEFFYENFFFPDGSSGTARRDLLYQRLIFKGGIHFQTPKKR
jgi:hypothetical protein